MQRSLNTEGVYCLCLEVPCQALQEEHGRAMTCPFDGMPIRWHEDLQSQVPISDIPDLGVIPQECTGALHVNFVNAGQVDLSDCSSLASLAAGSASWKQRCRLHASPFRHSA